MINRNYREGEQLDVAGLNKITVLLDRSETELTEVGMNEWRPNLDGPPHKHNDKDQVFYITSGKGKVIVCGKEFDTHPGCAVYVPAGCVHQTITTSEEPFVYLLLNIFNNPDKEGHASFKDHIEKVKMIRKQQAESGETGDDSEGDIKVEKKDVKFFETVLEGKTYEFGSNSTVLLLDRNEANNFELVVVKWSSHNRGAMVAHSEKEQSFFILKGTGEITIGDETEKVVPGNLVFVPRDTPHTTESFDEELVYLCLNSYPVEPEDESFDAMYNRIAPERIKRWESGSSEVGE
ncbi:MAG: cupin domain-containing protein [Chlorobi bacterium]|nr:cupin domain-containing protein [Chlorobiota bacterium]